MTDKYNEALEKWLESIDKPQPWCLHFNVTLVSVPREKAYVARVVGVILPEECPTVGVGITPYEALNVLREGLVDYFSTDDTPLVLELHMVAVR